MRQGETEHIAAGCNCHILHTVHCVSHWRGTHNLAGIEVPQGAASTGVNRFKRFAVVSKEQQSSSCRQSSAPGLSVTDLHVAPHNFSVRRRKRKQHLLQLFGGRSSGASVVKSLPRGKLSGLCEKSIAALEGNYVEESCLRVVGGRKPICRSFDPRANVCPFWRRDSSA